MVDPDRFFDGEQVVVTEKVDGECTTIYPDGTFHARSTDGQYHNTSQWIVRRIAENVALWPAILPEGWRLVGENLQIQHSIPYNNLTAFFLVFGIYDADNICIEWDQVIHRTRLLDNSTDTNLRIFHVPEIYVGVWDKKKIESCFTGVSLYGGKQEGYVVRKLNSFPWNEHETSTAKFVRKDHVQAHNWRRGPFTPNQLRDGF